MKRSSYGDRDYAFGKAMLTLRTASGMTQAGLADRLGVSRQAVVGWEAGSSYPQPHHLKRFIELCLQQGAFPAGHEAEEIRSFWKAAHQKVLLDENWLEAILPKDPLSTEIAAPEPIAITGIKQSAASPASAPPPNGSGRHPHAVHALWTRGRAGHPRPVDPGGTLPGWSACWAWVGLGSPRWPSG